MKQTIKLLALSVLTAACFALIKAPAAHAATLTVASGNDETTVNSTCSLSEAITNINNGNDTTYPECTNSSTDPYGTNDTITLPAGTITLVADVPTINKDTSIQGQGMGVSVVDGASQYKGFQAQALFKISDLTVTAMKDQGIFSAGNGMTAEKVEVDGTNWGISDPSGVVLGMAAAPTLATANPVVNLSNIYIHSFNVEAAQLMPLGIVGGFGFSVDFTVHNVTVSNITNIHTSPSQTYGLVMGAGLFDNGSSPGVVNGTVSNITISNIHGAGTAYGVGQVLLDVSGQTQSVSVRNITVTNIQGDGTDFIGRSGGIGIASFGGSMAAAHTTLNITNALISAGSNAESCLVLDIGPILQINGTAHVSLSSHGGNLSSDSSCTSFTQPTDHNNLTTLSSTLAPLADNGGYVPTIALLPTSPAIDAGITLSDLTTDARLATRPQGHAYDSGAYESPYTRSTLAETGASVTIVSVIAMVALSTGLALLTIWHRQNRLVKMQS